MPSNPLIVTAQDLAAYIRDAASPFKSRPISGAPGLTIEKSHARWVFSFKHEGRRFHGSLGTYPTVSLKAAKAAFLRKRFAVMDGKAPAPRPRRIRAKPVSQAGSAAKTTPMLPAMKFVPTFNELKAVYFRYRYDKLVEEGTNKLPMKSVNRMENLFEQYAAAVIGTLPVNEIRNSHIIKILSGINTEASRTKTKAVVSLFLQWLIFNGVLDPDALHIDWTTINKALPKITKVSNNYPRLAIEDVPRFVACALRPRKHFLDNIACVSLVLLLLTAQRSGQIFCPDTIPDNDFIAKFCHWEDIDMQKRIWTVPAEYMKISTDKGRALPAFRIPISKETAWCLNRIKSLWADLGILLKDSDFVVPQYDDPSRPQKSHALRRVLEKVVHKEALAETGQGFFDPDQPGKLATVHGFRSCFADWASNQGFAESLVEKALAHSLPRVQRAYQRDDLLEARRPMMEAWGEYCFSQVSFKI